MNNIYESSNYDISYRGILTDDNNFKIFTANNSITINNELSFDINADFRSSLNYFSSSILGGIVHSILSQSSKNSIEIEELEAKIHLNLKNPLTLIGVKGYNEEPKIESCDITIYLYSETEETELLEFCKIAITRCFIYNTLKNSVTFNIKYILID